MGELLSTAREEFRFSANLSMLFQDLPFLERIGAAAAAGFDGVECWWPYAEPAAEVERVLNAAGSVMRMINTPPGPPEYGGRGLAAIVGAEALFRDTLTIALDYAGQIGARHVHVMSGIVPEGQSAERGRATLISNLAAAADIARDGGVDLLIEAICPEATPGYFLNSLVLASDIVADVGRAEVGLLYDDYHATMLGESDHLADVAEHVRHVQAAAVPGRNEPENITGLLVRLEAARYTGWVGGEYIPRGGTAAGLSWLYAARNWTGE